MFHWFKRVLDDEDLRQIDALFANAAFSDGKKTAVGGARGVKNNEQMDASDEQQQVDSLIQAALKRNEAFQSAVMPYRIRPVRLSRYQAGMAYGQHIDMPFADTGEHYVRSDVSATLFLNEPGHYKGGELMIKMALGEQPIKLNRGDLIAYPSTTLHRVAPVTDGERRVAVLWMQSLVKDAAQREMLYELDRVRQKLYALAPECEEAALANKTHANLLRAWSEM